MASRPTKNPRIQFVPSDAAKQVIEHYSKLTGQSRASVVSELMTDLVPHLTKQAETYESYLNRHQQALEFAASITEESERLKAQGELPLKKPRRQRKAKGALNGPP